MHRSTDMEHAEPRPRTSSTQACLEAAPGSSVRELLERACARIAPTWPLDRFIAVNPFWEMVQQPMPDVAAKLGSLSGTRLLMSRSWYRSEVQSGRVTVADLREAATRRGATHSVAQLVAMLDTDTPALRPSARVMDVADEERDAARVVLWRDFVTTSTSQFCASYFDDGQGALGADRSAGLYASFRRHAQGDRSPALLMGFDSYRALASELPDNAEETATIALRDLGVADVDRETYLTGLLLDLNGWAAWCAYARWTARLAGRQDAQLVDLLAVRLAWEWMLLRAAGPRVAQRWASVRSSFAIAEATVRASQQVDWIFQDAVEIAWQRRVCSVLPDGFEATLPMEPKVQAVFCIDVRSEVFRRALESRSESIQTLGFAGFFGLPVDYQPLASTWARPQLPGLLAPRLRVTDHGASAELSSQRAERLGVNASWNAFRSGTTSTFAFVEAMGLFYGGRLFRDGLGKGAAPFEAAGLTTDERAQLKPRLSRAVDGNDLSVEQRADLAQGILKGMALSKNLARLVLLAGHGSEVHNNPHRAALDCGACCGQTGEVNARAAAALLNDLAVRDVLSARGIFVPEATRFVAGLHNTTTDEVTLFDVDELPVSHVDELRTLRQWLTAAGEVARAERAPSLGLPAMSAVSLHTSLKKRSANWAEVRPEWGLANNAAFIVAPRERSKHMNLGGRSFLHDYRFQDDDGFAILELIMTAPMVVTHWINLQYYASTVDNLRYGSGNKVLHNVVGGHVGVFEGNGGDLRIGLPMQSLHDGERWVHQPLRLSVFIEAPLSAIDGVIAKHATVRHLVTNGWVHLFQIDAARKRLHAYRGQRWVAADEAAS